MEEYFKLQARHYYDSVDFTNFEKELERALLIKKTFKKYFKTGYINLRLVLNHIIILYNYFNNYATDILFHVIPEDQFPLLNTFLIFLNRLPPTEKDVKIDSKIQEALRRL